MSKESTYRCAVCKKPFPSTVDVAHHYKIGPHTKSQIKEARRLHKLDADREYRRQKRDDRGKGPASGRVFTCPVCRKEFNNARAVADHYKEKDYDGKELFKARQKFKAERAQQYYTANKSKITAQQRHYRKAKKMKSLVIEADEFGLPIRAGTLTHRRTKSDNRYCTNCGAKFGPDWKFCGSCGRQVK